MKAVILLATLKKEGLSNTETLSEFLVKKMEEEEIECEIVKLVNYNIPPGTYSDMGAGDEWPKILNKILDAQIIIFATPVWWGNQSSLMQKVIERLDELHDEISSGKESRLLGKVSGIVVTGDSDGAEHIIGNIANFFNAIGLLLPPYATLSVLSEKNVKGANSSKEELMELYEKSYSKSADIMTDQLVKFANLIY